jgi:hypothetical protein
MKKIARTQKKYITSEKELKICKSATQRNLQNSAVNQWNLAVIYQNLEVTY